MGTNKSNMGFYFAIFLLIFLIILGNAPINNSTSIYTLSEFGEKNISEFNNDFIDSNIDTISLDAIDIPIGNWTVNKSLNYGFVFPRNPTDFDNDNLPEIFVSSAPDGTPADLLGITNLQLLEWDKTTSNFSTVVLKKTYPNIMNPNIIDIYNNGSLYVLLQDAVAGNNRPYVLAKIDNNDFVELSAEIPSSDGIYAYDTFDFDTDLKSDISLVYGYYMGKWNHHEFSSNALLNNSQYSHQSTGSGVFIDDLNNDGEYEIIVASYGGLVTIYNYESTNSFSEQFSYQFPNGPNNIFAWDYDQDGFTNLLSYVYDVDAIKIYSFEWNDSNLTYEMQIESTKINGLSSGGLHVTQSVDLFGNGDQYLLFRGIRNGYREFGYFTWDGIKFNYIPIRSGNAGETVSTALAIQLDEDPELEVLVSYENFADGGRLWTDIMDFQGTYQYDLIVEDFDADVFVLQNQLNWTKSDSSVSVGNGYLQISTDGSYGDFASVELPADTKIIEGRVRLVSGGLDYKTPDLFVYDDSSNLIARLGANYHTNGNAPGWVTTPYGYSWDLNTPFYENVWWDVRLVFKDGYVSFFQKNPKLHNWDLILQTQTTGSPSKLSISQPWDSEINIEFLRIYTSSEVNTITIPNINSPFMSTLPSIDGTVNVAEWTDAYYSSTDFYNQGMGTTIPVDLYIGNDETYLYLALSATISSGWDGFASVSFDGNNNDLYDGNAGDLPHIDFKAERASPDGWSGYTNIGVVYDSGGLTLTSVANPSGLISASAGSSAVSYEYRIPLNVLGVNTLDAVGMALFVTSDTSNINLRYGWPTNNTQRPIGNYYYLDEFAQINLGSSDIASEPQNLIASNGDALVDLTWSAPVSDGGSSVAGYRVYRSSTSGGPYSLLADLGVVYSYSDVSAINGNSYYYIVRAVNSFGESADSNEAIGSPQEIINIPSNPQSLIAISGNNVINLTWSASADDGGSSITGYRVYRSTSSGGPYSLLADLGVVYSYSDISVINGNTYYYIVRAVNIFGESNDSNEVSGKSEISFEIQIQGSPDKEIFINTDYTLIWQIEGVYDRYEIFENEILLSSLSYDGSTINFNIHKSRIGLFEYSIIIYAGETTISDTVLVNVVGIYLDFYPDDATVVTEYGVNFEYVAQWEIYSNVEFTYQIHVNDKLEISSSSGANQTYFSNNKITYVLNYAYSLEESTDLVKLIVIYDNNTIFTDSIVILSTDANISFNFDSFLTDTTDDQIKEYSAIMQSNENTVMIQFQLIIEYDPGYLSIVEIQGIEPSLYSIDNSIGRILLNIVLYPGDEINLTCKIKINKEGTTFINIKGNELRIDNRDKEAMYGKSLVFEYSIEITVNDSSISVDVPVGGNYLLMVISTYFIIYIGKRKFSIF
ncbi:MAG: hypothetical protein GPJ54_11055 [Candidatus Heimdallarchaeota archaeon]|nr:hypothetical protein [Candidatus Heimdallarchaeota archaeon]